MARHKSKQTPFSVAINLLGRLISNLRMVHGWLLLRQSKHLERKHFGN